ncbi:MAG: SdpI family protein [Caldisericaceae bacterium]
MKSNDLPFLDTFLIYYLLPIILIFGGIAMLYIKQNEWVGLRTPATLSDPEVWEKANKVTGILFIVVGIVFLPFNIASYLLKWPIWIQIGLMLVIPIGLGIFGLTYSDRLKMQKNDIKGKPFIISKSLVYTIFIISIFAIIVNISVFFIFSNSFIAVRICGMVVAVLG